MSGLSQVSLPEWRSIRVAELDLITREDYRLAEKLEAERRLFIDRRRDDLEIRAESWVGVIRFSHFQVSVVPKLSGEFLGLTRLLSFVYDLNCEHFYDSDPDLDAHGHDLLDLLAYFFTIQCEKLLQRGILEDYREYESGLPVIRGRFLADRQLLRRMGNLDKLECRYDDRTPDIPENQLLGAAASACSRRISSTAVLPRINRLRAHMQSICDPSQLDFDWYRRNAFYDRLNHVYEAPHRLAWLLLDNLAFEDFEHLGSAPCFSFLVDMNKIFERFLEKWLEFALRDTRLSVRSQVSESSVIRYCESGRSYSSIRPDILVSEAYADNRPTRVLPIDAKYKLYDDRSVQPSDLYQAFLYGFAFGSHGKELEQQNAVIFHPATNDDHSPIRLEINPLRGVSGGKVTIAAINVQRALEEALAESPGIEAERTLAIIQEMGLS